MHRLGLLALTLSAAAFAQQTGGTFETTVPQQIVPSVQPLVSTPTLTLSNGFSPATVTMPNSIVDEQPQTMTASGMPQSEGVTEGTPSASTSEMKLDFNFSGFSSITVFNGFDSSVSLGEIARHFRKSDFQPHKMYTNEDIDHLTSENPDSGIIYAKLANGQPIEERNRGGFSPMSGIANMPGVGGNDEGTQLANSDQGNLSNEGQGSATASNNDQGRENGQSVTTPSADSAPATNGNGNQQMPASDNPR